MQTPFYRPDRLCRGDIYGLQAIARAIGYTALIQTCDRALTWITGQFIRDAYDEQADPVGLAAAVEVCWALNEIDTCRYEQAAGVGLRAKYPCLYAVTDPMGIAFPTPTDCWDCESHRLFFLRHGASETRRPTDTHQIQFFETPDRSVSHLRFWPAWEAVEPCQGKVWRWTLYVEVKERSAS